MCPLLSRWLVDQAILFNSSSPTDHVYPTHNKRRCFLYSLYTVNISIAFLATSEVYTDFYIAHPETSTESGHDRGAVNIVSLSHTVRGRTSKLKSLIGGNGWKLPRNTGEKMIKLILVTVFTGKSALWLAPSTYLLFTSRVESIPPELWTCHI